jgi:hypothetical protein
LQTILARFDFKTFGLQSVLARMHFDSERMVSQFVGGKAQRAVFTIVAINAANARQPWL